MLCYLWLLPHVSTRKRKYHIANKISKMSEEQATQLADTRPYLDTPLRVTIPVNVPVRVLAPSRDKSIYEDMYSPMAISAAKREGETLSSAYDHAYRDMPNVQSPFLYKAKNAVSTGMVRNKNVSSEHEAMLKNSLKDYTVLAQSSRRAGKKDVEGQAYASLGVVFDNDEQYLLAIDYYLKYLSVSEELNDNMGIAAACNCIGVDYMTLANPNCESSITLSHLFAEQANLETLEYIHKAIDYHTRHLDVGPDAGGKLVAHINLGICLTWLGDINRAARHHQDALRIAIKMQTLYGQAIAVGNLGLLAMGKSDFSTSRTCFDQHLQLIQALMDAEAEINAWKLCADLASVQGNYPVALEHLEQARLIAEREQLWNELRRVHVLVGIAKGTMEFTEYATNLPLPDSQRIVT